MTTELVLLLSVFAFVTGGAIFGEKGPFQVFKKSTPRLAARVEQNLATGRDFKIGGPGNKSIQSWIPPQGAAPDGQL
jgi:hypothetical protein